VRQRPDIPEAGSLVQADGQGIVLLDLKVYPPRPSGGQPFEHGPQQPLADPLAAPIGPHRQAVNPPGQSVPLVAAPMLTDQGNPFAHHFASLLSDQEDGAFPLTQVL
jgi:hypothetical protein